MSEDDYEDMRQVYADQEEALSVELHSRQRVAWIGQTLTDLIEDCNIATYLILHRPGWL